MNLPSLLEAVIEIFINFFHFISQSYYLFRQTIADRDNTEFQLDIKVKSK